MAEETATSPAVETAPPTLATSAMFRLCEELIALREQNSRQHKLFEQAQARTRDDLQGAFNAFAADTQRAYQQLRQEFSGEKRVSLALLNELLDLAEDVQTIADARPDLEGANEAIVGWAGAIDVQAQGTCGPRTPRHPPVRRRAGRPVRSRHSRACRRPAGGGGGSVPGGRAEPARLCQPTAGIRAPASEGDRVGIVPWRVADARNPVPERSRKRGTRTRRMVPSRDLRSQGR